MDTKDPEYLFINDNFVYISNIFLINKIIISDIHLFIELYRYL